MASSPIVWTPDKRMILQSAVADLSPEAFQAVVSKVFGPATLAKRRRQSHRDAPRRRRVVAPLQFSD